MPIQKHVLNNTLTLITEPIAEAKTAAIGFWFFVGSRHETPSTRGVTHFVEHMLFKGTKTRTAFDIASAFDRVGAAVNAFTERDATCLYATVPFDFVPRAFEILCDMMHHSVFDENDIEKERKVIINEIITSKDDSEEAAVDALYETLWRGHSLSYSIAGSVKDVKRLTRDDMYNWYKTHFCNGKLLVTVSGNFNEKMIIETLSHLPPRILAANCNAETAPLWLPTRVSTYAPFSQNQVFASFPLPSPLNEHENNCWLLLNAIIGDTMSSRLFQRLRETNGFCYNVYSFFTVFEDAAFWCVYASVSRPDTAHLIRELHDEFADLLQNGVSEEEVACAKDHICGEELIAGEDVENRMKRLSQLYFAEYPLCTIEEHAAQIRSLTVRNLNEVVSRALQTKNETLFVYGRYKEKK